MSTESNEEIPIPTAAKTLCWNRWVGGRNNETMCLCCKENKIQKNNFVCGYIISPTNDITYLQKLNMMTVENLRPICEACSLSNALSKFKSDESYRYSNFSSKENYPVCYETVNPVDWRPNMIDYFGNPIDNSDTPVDWRPKMMNYCGNCYYKPPKYVSIPKGKYYKIQEKMRYSVPGDAWEIHGDIRWSNLKFKYIQISGDIYQRVDE